jgi:hypothetical protein
LKYHGFPALVLGNPKLSSRIINFIYGKWKIGQFGVDPSYLFLGSFRKDENA